MFMYRNVYNLLPNVFDSLFLKNADIHDHDTRNAQHFHINHVRTTISLQSLRNQAPRCFNYFIKHVPLKPKIRAYKSFLKEHLKNNTPTF